MTAEQNREVFDGADAVATYRQTGWTDVGEQRAVASVAGASHDGRILDLGFGAGRTTGLLTLISEDYVGLDYARAMVEAARRRHPGRRLEQGDARDLSAYDDGSVDLVVFSFNGVDCLDHEDRARALAEMARVLAPGGHLVFSTLNLDGPVPRQRPWLGPELARPAALRDWPAYLYAFALSVLQLPSRTRHYRRGRRAEQRGEEWAMLPLAIHSYALLCHFTTLARVRREVKETGLEVLRIVADDGRELGDAAHDAEAGYVHVVAQRPPRSGGSP